MMHPDQASSILESLGIAKAKLSPQGQRILEELASISHCLQVNPSCLDLPAAVTEALMSNSESTAQINTEISTLLAAQQHLKQSFLLLHKLKQIKSSLVESTSHLNETISSRLIPQKKELQARLQNLTPKWEIDEELRHEFLIDLAGTCQDVSRQTAALQVRAEMYKDIPPVISI